jgi:hypothetical protein
MLTASVSQPKNQGELVDSACRSAPNNRAYADFATKKSLMWRTFNLKSKVSF